MNAERWESQAVDLETFKALDKPTRQLILRLLDEPTDRDWEDLRQHPQGEALASWLLLLPAYAATPDIEDDTPPTPPEEYTEDHRRLLAEMDEEGER